MKKHLGLLFFGLFITAAGIGCFSAAFNNDNIKPAEAKDDVSYIQLDENETCLFGEYPQKIVTTVSADDIRTQGAIKETPYGGKYYLYHSKKYAIVDTALVDTEGSGGRTLSNGELVNSYNGFPNAVFEFNQIEWQLLKKCDDGTAYLITTNVIDRHIYHENLPEHVSYENSYLYDYLNRHFKEMAFPYDSLNYFADSKGLMDNVTVTVPKKEDVDLDGYPDKNLKQASDYAILQELTSHSAYNHGSGVPYLNAGYWLQDFSYDQDRIVVCWPKVAFSHCLMDDSKIGVRPVIHVNYKEKGSGGGGGSGSTHKNTKTGSGNVTLALGITFTVVGAGGLIAFFIVWGKKHPTGKPPVWIIITIAGSLVVSIVGLSCLASGISGGGGGAGCFNYGYYVQTGTHSGNGIVQVGTTAWLFKSDGTVYYCSHLKDAENASDFAPDNYMTGTYKISGSKLTITIPEREIQNFGKIGGVTVCTIKNCKYLYEGGVEVYHWVRGE